MRDELTDLTEAIRRVERRAFALRAVVWGGGLLVLLVAGVGMVAVVRLVFGK